MKKIVASVGLVALGASSLHADLASSFNSDSDLLRDLSVSATLRGFYDDNINSIPDNYTLQNGAKRDSFGFEVSPSITFNMPLEQTTLGLSYNLSAKYYENKLAWSGDRWDLTHTINASVDHTFNSRFQAGVRDSFVIGQEPDILRAGNAFETWQRIPGDNIRNFGVIDFRGQITPLLELQAGYGNAFYDYADFNEDEFNVDNAIGLASPAATLNRLEHTIHLDSRWHMLPETVGVLGYQFRMIDYTADEVIAVEYDSIGDVLAPIMSDARNARIHYGYLGVDHSFSSSLSASLRGGANYADYYNTGYGDSTVAPYFLTSVRWTYLPQSFVEIGFSHDLNSTDQTGYIGVGNSADHPFTLDSESSIVFAKLTHRIMPKLFGNITAQFQNSDFNGGTIDGKCEQYYLAGVTLDYHLDRHWIFQVGYNFDKLDSDIGRSFDRNRVYVGVTATY